MFMSPIHVPLDADPIAHELGYANAPTIDDYAAEEEARDWPTPQPALAVAPRR